MIHTSVYSSNFAGNSMSGNFSTRKLAVCLSMALTAAMLQACGVATIKDIKPTPQVPIERNKMASFDVTGLGTCTKMSVDFGDGSPAADAYNVNLATISSYTHVYTGWGGGKIVTAEGITNCVGKVQMRVKVLPEVLRVGVLAPRPTACDLIPNMPPLRKHTLVHAKNPPGFSLLSNPLSTINFGCTFGCVYNLFGENAPAPPTFPFPGLRKYSMVLRVGTQVEQGPTVFDGETTFTTNQAGPLEICENDEKLSDNSGGWGVDISVDDLGS